MFAALLIAAGLVGNPPGPAQDRAGDQNEHGRADGPQTSGARAAGHDHGLFHRGRLATSLHGDGEVPRALMLEVEVRIVPPGVGLGIQGRAEDRLGLAFAVASDNPYAGVRHHLTGLWIFHRDRDVQLADHGQQRQYAEADLERAGALAPDLGPVAVGLCGVG
ncbi:MAG: hypothetical protein ACOC5K_02265 [Chloroflexota bacterium]